MKKANRMAKIKDCSLAWSTDCPYCIIMCLLGREVGLLSNIGIMDKYGIHFKMSDEDIIAKYMFVYEITSEEIEHASSICSKKGIFELNYFLDILKNIIEMRKITD